MQAIVGRSRSFVLIQLKPTTIRVANSSNIAPYVPDIVPPKPLPGNLRTINLKSSYQSDAFKLNKQVAFNIFKSASEKKLVESFKKRYEEQLQNLNNLKKERRKLSSQYVNPNLLVKKISDRDIKFQQQTLILERDWDDSLQEHQKDTPKNYGEARAYYYKQRVKEELKDEIGIYEGPLEVPPNLLETETTTTDDNNSESPSTTTSTTDSLNATTASTTPNTTSTTPTTTTTTAPTTTSETNELEENNEEEDNEDEIRETTMEEDIAFLAERIKEFNENFEWGDWDDYVPHPTILPTKTYWDDAPEHDKTLASVGLNSFTEQIKNKKFAQYLDQKKGGYQQALEYLDNIELKNDPDMFNKTTLKAARFAGDYGASEYYAGEADTSEFLSEIERLEFDQESIPEESLQRLMQVKMARFGLHVPPTPGQFEEVADNLIKKIENSASEEKKLFLVNILRKHLTSIYNPNGKVIVSSHKWFPPKADPKMERKVHLKVKVSSLKLPQSVRSRLLEMVEKRYNPTTDILTIVGDDLATKSLNRNLVKKTFAALLHEAWKAHDSYVAMEPIPAAIDLNDSSFLQQIPENYTIFHVTP